MFILFLFFCHTSYRSSWHTCFWTWCKKAYNCHKSNQMSPTVTPGNQMPFCGRTVFSASLLQSVSPSFSLLWVESLLKLSKWASQGFIRIVDAILRRNFRSEENVNVSSTAECRFYFEYTISSDSGNLVSIIKFLWQFWYSLSRVKSDWFLRSISYTSNGGGGTPLFWVKGAPLFWVTVLPRHISVCGDGRVLVWSSQLPVPLWALSALTTIPL